jgi:hypothetical protein
MIFVFVKAGCTGGYGIEVMGRGSVQVLEKGWHACKLSEICATIIKFAT